MFYTLLGRMVWKLARRRLKSRARYRPRTRSRGGRPLSAVLLAAMAGLGFLLSRRARSARTGE